MGPTQFNSLPVEALKEKLKEAQSRIVDLEFALAVQAGISESLQQDAVTKPSFIKEGSKCCDTAAKLESLQHDHESVISELKASKVEKQLASTQKQISDEEAKDADLQRLLQEAREACVHSEAALQTANEQKNLLEQKLATVQQDYNSAEAACRAVTIERDALQADAGAHVMDMDALRQQLSSAQQRCREVEKSLKEELAKSPKMTVSAQPAKNELTTMRQRFQKISASNVTLQEGHKVVHDEAEDQRLKAKANEEFQRLNAKANEEFMKAKSRHVGLTPQQHHNQQVQDAAIIKDLEQGLEGEKTKLEDAKTHAFWAEKFRKRLAWIERLENDTEFMKDLLRNAAEVTPERQNLKRSQPDESAKSMLAKKSKAAQ